MKPAIGEGREAVAHHIHRLPAQPGPIHRPIPPPPPPHTIQPHPLPSSSRRRRPQSVVGVARGLNSRHRSGPCTSLSTEPTFGHWRPITRNFPSDWCGQRRLLPYPLLQSARCAHPCPHRCSRVVADEPEVMRRREEAASGNGTGEAKEVGDASSS